MSVVINLAVHNDDRRAPRAGIIGITNRCPKGGEPESTIIHTNALAEVRGAWCRQEFLEERRRLAGGRHPAHLAVQTAEYKVPMRSAHHFAGKHMGAALVALLRKAAHRGRGHIFLIELIEIAETKQLLSTEPPIMCVTHAIYEGSLAADMGRHAETAAHRHSLLTAYSKAYSDRVSSVGQAERTYFATRESVVPGAHEEVLSDSHRPGIAAIVDLQKEAPTRRQEHCQIFPGGDRKKKRQAT